MASASDQSSWDKLVHQHPWTKLIEHGIKIFHGWEGIVSNDHACTKLPQLCHLKKRMLAPDAFDVWIYNQIYLTRKLAEMACNWRAPKCNTFSRCFIFRKACSEYLKEEKVIFNSVELYLKSIVEEMSGQEDAIEIHASIQLLSFMHAAETLLSLLPGARMAEKTVLIGEILSSAHLDLQNGIPWIASVLESSQDESNQFNSRFLNHAIFEDAAQVSSVRPTLPSKPAHLDPSREKKKFEQCFKGIPAHADLNRLSVDASQCPFLKRRGVKQSEQLQRRIAGTLIALFVFLGTFVVLIELHYRLKKWSEFSWFHK